MKILGLDVGEKRIGVAKVDSSTRIAVPVGFINVDGTEWAELARLANLNSTTFFVLGLPRSNEGNETAQSVYVRNFAKALVEKVPGAKVRFQDESLTSVVAEERLKSRQKNYEKGNIDVEAATIILQDFIETFSEKSAPEPADTNLIKKEMDKVKMKTKKVTKWVSGIAVLLVLALIATGVALVIREQRRKERAEYYAEIEAGMKAEVFSFTILPGETIMDVKKKLLELGYSAEEIEAAFNAQYDYSFLAGRPEGASLEGYLFGETHEFYEGETVENILREYLGLMGKVIEENNLEARYGERGLTLFEGITLASVVQKEAKSPDQPTVAQVFLSRIASGIPLGSDVTVSYAVDLVDPNREIYNNNYDALRIESCYNTRYHTGFPCGPISNPGLSALLAVAEPTDTEYLYFLTGDDGVMYYGYTEYEHNQNIRDHCQELCNVQL